MQSGVRRITAYTAEKAGQWEENLKTQIKALQVFLSEPGPASHSPTDMNPLENPFIEQVKFFGSEN